MLGIAYYLGRKARFDMSLKVLLLFDWHLRREEIRPLANGKGIFETAPHTGVHVLLSGKNAGANQVLNVCFKTVKPLLFR